MARVKRRGRSGTCFCISAILGIALLAIVAAYVLRPEPGLLDHAARLVGAMSWSPGFGSYFWESDRSILTFRPTSHSVRAVSVDLPTGSETERSGLTEDIRSWGTAINGWRLSPDGMLLLWRSQSSGPAEWHVSNLMGKRVRTWQDGEDGIAPLWLRDSRSWLEGLYSYSGVPYGRTGVIHSLEGKDLQCGAMPGPYEWAIGVTPGREVISFRWSGPTRGAGAQIEWFVYSLSAKPGLSQHCKVPMPDSATGVAEAELSGDGTRIACFVRYTYLSSLEKLLARFVPKMIHVHSKVGLWILRRDGRGTQLVGSEEGGAPYGLLWTPDDKRISFVLNNTLYSVPGEMPR